MAQRANHTTGQAHKITEQMCKCETQTEKQTQNNHKSEDKPDNCPDNSITQQAEKPRTNIQNMLPSVDEDDTIEVQNGRTRAKLKQQKTSHKRPKQQHMRMQNAEHAAVRAIEHKNTGLNRLTKSNTLEDRSDN